MVRVSTHPMRLLSLQYGADYVYTEEIIDFKLLRTTRVKNKLLNTIDYIHPDGTLVFRTSEEERGKVILQLGTANPDRALEAAKKVEQDVAAIDVNMGCPKEFSIKGGMGAALLKKPEQTKIILTTLVQGLQIPVTCKIRILPKLEDTLSLVKLIESTGVAAIAVHGRKQHERSRDPNHEDVILAVANAVRIPILANGGSKSPVLLHEDVEFFRQATGAAGVMLARAAMWNPTIFAQPSDNTSPATSSQIIREYLKLAVKYDHHFSGAKYCIQRMFLKSTTSEKYRKTLSSSTMTELCTIWKVPEDVMEQSKKCTGNRVCTQMVSEAGLVVDDEYAGAVKRSRLEGDGAVANGADGGENTEGGITVPIEFFRADWPTVGNTPRQILLEYCKKSKRQFPTFTTEENRKSRTFTSTVCFDGIKYSHTIPSKTKRFAEQAACLACLTHLQIPLTGSLANKTE